MNRRNRKRRRDKEAKREESFEIESSTKSKVDLWLETKCVSPSSLLLSPSSSPQEDRDPPPHRDDKDKISESLGESSLFSSCKNSGGDDFENAGEIVVEEEDEDEPAVVYVPAEEDLMEMEEEDECTAEDLARVLQSCRVCFESQDTPANSIWCIIGHLKYLCIFCFRIVEKDDLVRHTKSERSRERCIEGREFKCPYVGCSELFYKLDDSFEGVHDLFERLYFHVVNSHLPKSYERLEEDGGEPNENSNSNNNINAKKDETTTTTSRVTSATAVGNKYVSCNGSLMITRFHEEEVNERIGAAAAARDSLGANCVVRGRSNHNTRFRNAPRAREEEEVIEIDDEDTTTIVIDVEMEELDYENRKMASKNYNKYNTCGTSPDSGVEENIITEEQALDFSRGVRNDYRRDQRYSSEPSEIPTVLVEEEDDDEDEVVILSVTKRKQPPKSTVGTAFICGFCNTAFNLKRRLHDHYEKKYCKKLKDKKCQNCQIGFSGYTVLEVVMHLLHKCRPPESSS